VFSSHLASSTFSSPDQLASILVRQDDREDRDRKRKDDGRAAHAITSDTQSTRDTDRSSTSHKHSRHSKSKKRAHREKGQHKDRKRREERDKDTSKSPSMSRSALSSSPTQPPHSIHQDEDMSDSDWSSDEELQRGVGVDRHERGLAMGSVGKPAAIY